ncbi:MAG: molecular chaperone TorD family protein [Planctomycetes bacterium]|nr:molecular chaperone TorD family protein [Planctomycetota bacterium]
MPYSSSVEESELARARAAAYGLIAHGFQYPDGDTISTLVDPRRWENWPDVLQKVDGQVGRSLQSVQDAVRAFADCSQDAHQELQHRYDDLFGHAVRGRCPAYEMEYGRNEIIRQASDLADLAGFYRAFGLEIANGANGRPDHIAAECEFMSALCAKEAHAYTQGNKKNADICLDAERAFLRDHLARWLPALAYGVQAADADGLFGALARFADAFVKAECSHYDIHAGPPTLELKPPDPVLDTQISCGPTGCGEGRADEQLVQLGLDMGGSESR